LSEEWHLGVKTKNPKAFHALYGTHNCTKSDFYIWFKTSSINLVNSVCEVG